jgi:carbonic anhydrase
MIDITYRIGARGQSSRRTPLSTTDVQKRLEKGNTHFSGLIAGMRAGKPLHHVTPVSATDLGLGGGECAVQSPYAAVLSCSDARVPIEMVLQQGFNDLFVVRVAGNVLGNECLGSMRYAASHFSETLKVVGVLGHANCGAVTAAVDAFLKPGRYLELAGNYALRTIIDQIMVSVRSADLGLREVHGPEVASDPDYRNALIRAAVALNAAWNAFTLREGLAGHAGAGVKVVFAVYDLGSHTLGLLSSSKVPNSRKGFVEPPTNLDEFRALVRELCGDALRQRSGKIQRSRAARAR